VMAGMKICGSGIGARVRGVKGGGVRARSAGADSSLATGTTGAIEGCGAGAGAEEARRSGLRPDRSRDVGRSVCAGGSNAEGAMSGAVFAGTSSALGGGRGADTGSKLNGRF
jgi:hypothetical protein